MTEEQTAKLLENQDTLIDEVRQLSALVRNLAANQALDHAANQEIRDRVSVLERYRTDPCPPLPNGEAE